MNGRKDQWIIEIHLILDKKCSRVLNYLNQGIINGAENRMVERYLVAIIDNICQISRVNCHYKL